MCSNCAGSYEDPDRTAEMVVYDPHEDDRGRPWNAISALVLIGVPLSIPVWMALIAGVRWFLHHAK